MNFESNDQTNQNSPNQNTGYYNQGQLQNSQKLNYNYNQNNSTLNNNFNNNQQNYQNLNYGYNQNDNTVNNNFNNNHQDLNYSYNQNGHLNSNMNNNPNQESDPQKFNTGLSSIQQPKTNKKFKKIGIIAVVIAALIIAVILFLGNHGSQNGSTGYTAKYNETLKVKNALNDFEMEILSIEKDYPLYEQTLFETKGIAIKVKIKNKRDKELYLSFMGFELLDSTNKKIVSAAPMFDSSKEGAISTEIASGQTEIGYLFFYDMSNELNLASEDIQKLKIGALKTANYDDGVFTGDYDYYYFELN